MLLVLNNFMKNLFITKLTDWLCYAALWRNNKHIIHWSIPCSFIMCMWCQKLGRESEFLLTLEYGVSTLTEIEKKTADDDNFVLRAWTVTGRVTVRYCRKNSVQAQCWSNNTTSEGALLSDRATPDDVTLPAHSATARRGPTQPSVTPTDYLDLRHAKYKQFLPTHRQCGWRLDWPTTAWWRHNALLSFLTVLRTYIMLSC